MSEFCPTPLFEKEIQQSFQVPAIRPEFVTRLNQEILRRAAQKKSASRSPFRFRPAWGIPLIVFLVLVTSLFIFGPENVYATVLKFFGYVPGIGVIEGSNTIRILAEPVQVTRDGITVSVNQAVLTSSETRLNYGVSGVSLSAYPRSETDPGCMELPYLLLPDGTHIVITELSDPIPEKVQKATFVLPCIQGTIPGAAPSDWELPIEFVAAPPDFIILPVQDVSPQPSLTPNPTGQQPAAVALSPTPAPHAVLTVKEVIDTTDGYILLGSISPNLSEGNWLQITGALVLRDKDGNKVSYTYPTDPMETGSDLGDNPWSIEFKGAGVSFPLTISVNGVVISEVDPTASAELSIDVGSNPQPGQVFEINQEIQLAGYTVRLISVTANSDGYSFKIDPGSYLSGVGVEIEGHPASGGGGGGAPGSGVYNTSMVYDTLPVGKLTLRFSDPVSTGPTETWQTQWQPDTIRDFSSSTANAGTCWNAATYPTIPLLTNELDGTVIFTQLNPLSQIVSSPFNGTQQQVIADGHGGQGAITQDGSKLVYSSVDGTVVKDLVNGETDVIQGIQGRDYHWSPDGSRLAMVNEGDPFGIFIMDSDGQHLKQLTNLGYESIAGWSPDGTRLYYAIPSTSTAGFLLRSVDVASGESKDEFVLEDSSLKAPYPALSPDGKWIAYRARNNTSLYLKSMDGSPARLLLDQTDDAITGIIWDHASKILGVSLINGDSTGGEILLIQPGSCEAYRLPNSVGELDGLIIP